MKFIDNYSLSDNLIELCITSSNVADTINPENAAKSETNRPTKEIVDISP